MFRKIITFINYNKSYEKILRLVVRLANKPWQKPLVDLL
jgi:hypothetical protein